MTWPVVLVSTVTRGATRGQRHGGLHVVDLELQEHRQLLAWDDPTVDFSGRGGDRGLRGLEIVGERLFVAASRAIVEFDPELNEVRRTSCPALGSAHELAWRQGYLLVVSTVFDSILALNTETGRFDWGLLVRLRDGVLDVRQFDPHDAPPPAMDTVHLNHVAVVGEDVYISGLRLPWLLRLRDGDLDIVAELPPGTHNAQRTPGGALLYHDSAEDRLMWVGEDERRVIAVPRPDPRTLVGFEGSDPRLARPCFARGMCLVDEDRVIGGSSPATVVGYDLDAVKPVTQVRFSDDVRCAVHGIVPWPFDG